MGYPARRPFMITSGMGVYVAEPELRTDHTLRLWGRTFLRLHYAMACAARRSASSTAATAGRRSAPRRTSAETWRRGGAGVARA
jgi:hypothetical protein